MDGLKSFPEDLQFREGAEYRDYSGLVGVIDLTMKLCLGASANIQVSRNHCDVK